MKLQPLLSFTDLDDSPVSFRIPGLLRNSGKTLISAYRKTGKTTLALTLAESLSTGADFIGLRCDPVPGSVVYLNMELDQPMIVHYCTEMSFKPSRKVQFLDYEGRASQIELLNEEWCRKFTEQLYDANTSVLIIDPLHPLLVGNAESNDNDQTRGALELLGAIRKDAEIEHLFIIDHTGHADKTRSRGASSKEDWADSLWNITGEAGKPDRTLEVAGRGVGGTLHYRLDTTSGRLVAGEGKLTAWMRIHKAMRDADGVLNTTDIVKASDLSRTEVNNELKEHETRGDVVEVQPARGQRAGVWRLCEKF